MSLLQEALKRKDDDEAQRKSTAGSAETAPVHPPAENVNLSAIPQATDGKQAGISQESPPQSMPVPPLPQPATNQIVHRKASLFWVTAAIIAISIGLMITAGVGFFFYRCLAPIKSKISRQIYKTATITAEGTNATVAQPVTQKTAEKPESMLQVAAPVTGIPAQALAVMPGVQTDALTQQPASAHEHKPVSAKPALLRIKTPIASPSAVRWPVLKLTGILRGSGAGESTAFINGRMVRAGQTVEEVTVVEIQADGVLLKYGTEKRFLRVGATSY